MADPFKASPVRLCVTVWNVLVLRQRMYAKIEMNPQIAGRWDPIPCSGIVADHIKASHLPNPHRCYHIKFGSSVTKGVRIIRK